MEEVVGKVRSSLRLFVRGKFWRFNGNWGGLLHWFCNSYIDSFFLSFCSYPIPSLLFLFVHSI